MSRFFVGQRVRVVYSVGWPELAGEAGRITAASHYVDGPSAGKPCWIVTPDCWGQERAPRPGRSHGGNCLGCRDDQIEPIVLHEASELTFTELMDRCRAGEVANV